MHVCVYIYIYVSCASLHKPCVVAIIAAAAAAAAAIIEWFITTVERYSQQSYYNMSIITVT